MGVKCSQKNATVLFDGMDRRNSGSIDIAALIELFYTSDDRDGKDRERGRDDDDDRGRMRGADRSERGSRGGSIGESRDSERGRRGGRIILKRNEARLLMRKRPDLLEEIQMQMSGVNRERG